MTEERWLPVTAYEGFYEVSDFGRVRSLDRIITDELGRTSFRKGKVLSPGLSQGYRRVRLSVNAVGETISVHQLVAQAFLGHPPSPILHPEVCHGDGNRQNNYLHNLRWDTRAGNQADKRKHGTQHELAKSHCPSGHEYDEGNTYRLGNRRHCKSCGRVRSLAWYHANKKLDK